MPESVENVLYIWQDPEVSWINNIINYVEKVKKEFTVLNFPICPIIDKTIPFFKYWLDLCYELNILSTKRITLLSYKDHLLCLELCISRLNVKKDKKIADIEKKDVLDSHDKYVNKYVHSNIFSEDDMILKVYDEFLVQNNCTTVWKLFSILENSEKIKEYLSKQNYLLLGNPDSEFSIQFVKLLLGGKRLCKIIVESPLNISLENSPSPKSSVDINICEDSVNIEDLPQRINCTNMNGSATEEYSVEVILAFLSLLVNCRNELALSKAMVSPIINLNHAAFTELKHAATEKEMSMCQTVMSYVTRVRLGGKGYAPPADCPLQSYLKELELFVDLLNQLQTIIEEDLSKNAVKRVINITKNRLLKSNHKLRVESIENSAKDLMETANLLRNHHNDKQESNQIGQKSLNILYDLVNYKAYTSTLFDVDAILEQSTLERTPINLPPLMGYFRSPEEEEEPVDEDSGFSLNSLKSIKLDNKSTIEPAPVVSYFHHSLSNSISKSCIDENTPSKTTFKGCLSMLDNSIKPVVQKERRPLAVIPQNKLNSKRSLLNDASKPTAKKPKKQAMKNSKGKIQIKGQGQITSFFVKRN